MFCLGCCVLVGCAQSVWVVTTEWGWRGVGLEGGGGFCAIKYNHQPSFVAQFLRRLVKPLDHRIVIQPFTDVVYALTSDRMKVRSVDAAPPARPHSFNINPSFPSHTTTFFQHKPVVSAPHYHILST